MDVRQGRQRTCRAQGSLLIPLSGRKAKPGAERLSPASQSRLWTVTPTAGVPVVRAASRRGGWHLAIPSRQLSLLQLQESMEGIREENLPPCPGPAKDEVAKAEPAGSGQAEGLGRSCGWTRRGQLAWSQPGRGLAHARPGQGRSHPTAAAC